MLQELMRTQDRAMSNLEVGLLSIGPVKECF